MVYIIWHDSDYDLALWIYENSSLKLNKEKTILREMPKENNAKILLQTLKTPSDYQILPLIRFEHPDIIIQHIEDRTEKSQILFATEFMTHTPQWEHPAQRFSRIYGTSKCGIPIALVLPKKKIKLEKGRASWYTEHPYVVSPVIYSLFLKTSLMDKNPTLLFHWPDLNGYLKTDLKHPTAPPKEGEVNEWFTFLELAIKGKVNIKKPFIVNQLNRLASMKRPISVSNYNTIGIFPTQQIIKTYKLDKSKLTKFFIKNSTTLVFKPRGLSPPSSYFRTDPYAGMLCAFDNLFCRDKKGNKIVNILMRAENVELSKLQSKGTFIDTNGHDSKNCPFESFAVIQMSSVSALAFHINVGNCPYTSSKQQRIYSEVADVIVFDDAIYYR